MKKILFGLVATIMLSVSGHAQTLEESAVFILKGRVGTTEKTARTFELKNYNPRFTPASEYAINSVDYTDDGKYFDLKAGDGIYTSVIQFDKPTSSIISDNIIVVKSDSFNYNSQLNSDYSKGKIKIGCKVRQIHHGYSLLGNSCATRFGCTEFYDCTFEIEFEW